MMAPLHEQRKVCTIYTRVEGLYQLSYRASFCGVEQAFGSEGAPGEFEQVAQVIFFDRR